MQEIPDTTEFPWHSVEFNSVFSKLETSEAGLDPKEARLRLKLFGLNQIASVRTQTIPKILLRQVRNPIIYVLLFSTLLALVFRKFSDAGVVFSVVIFNTLIGFFQEYRAHRVIESLTSLIPSYATVVRGGERKSIATSHLVPGDLVLLESGDRIAADLRLISSKNLQCDESSLTGESVPAAKITDQVAENALIGDRASMAFHGTYVTTGRAAGIVVATGIKTEFGKISELIESVTPLQTPMSVAIDRIAKMITWGVFSVSVLLFCVGYLRGIQFFDAGLAAITLAVAAIPEGLPAIITIASSIGVQRMARRNAIIRQLPAVEALGSTSVICTDKTGTLTYNEMTVRKIWTRSGFSFVSGVGFRSEGTIRSEFVHEVEELLKGAVLCSDASLGKSFEPIGDPTEVAILICGRKGGLLEELIREKVKRIDAIPFESERRMMAVLVQDEWVRTIFVKGAPEEVVKISRVDRNLQEIVEEMAREGMRVLGLASKRVPCSHSRLEERDLKEGFEFLGFLGMIDPLRIEAVKAVQSCHRAGILVKMITGDHPLTAEAISREIGIYDEGRVLTGTELNSLSPEEWKLAARDVAVFARVSPEHKLKLVEVLQEMGQVVAMTGDGVNDAAALRRADIGVAMGIKGTAVAKEASDMILADDNFASIEAAVEEGRRVYDNLIKSLTFVLPTSLGQALVVILAILFFPLTDEGLLHPISPIQILWVNLVVAVALSLPLAFESAEPDIMRRVPRKKKSSLFSRFLILKTMSVSIMMALGTIGLFIWEYQKQIGRGADGAVALSEAQTMSVTAIIMFQIIYLFNCRNLKNKIHPSQFFSNSYIFMGVGAVLIAQLSFIYVPFMNRLFHSTRLDVKALAISLLVALLIVPLIGIEQLVSRKNLKT